ncbi:MAG TPA: transglutaminase domain-containing protein, partial [Anaerolineales bacterium]|nr:transglutaminase domain-containing protein [Anaerolineales bacterium]
DALLTVGAISGLVVVIAVVVPMINVRQIIHLFETPAKGGAAETSAAVGQSLGLSVPQPAGPYAQVADAGLPRVHLLGTGPELSRQVVMSLEVDDPLEGVSPRYYWRSLTYDIYTGRGWATSATTSVSYREGTNILEPDASARVVRLHVRLTDETGEFIFSAGDILALDWPFTLAWRAPSTRERFTDQFAGQVGKGDYRVDALVPTATASQLRAVNATLPEWIRARYLSLPEGIPARVYDMAAGVTIAQQTPFDRAVALERFLRSYPYSLDLPVPPTDQDVVDYFLFDLRRGYCDYYATAMVVLARASGLPARLAVGYASGTYDPANNRYVVTAADAHSWAEIYFPGVGWVPFEPTGGQAEIGRAETFSEAGLAPGVSQTPFEPVWMRGTRQAGWVAVGLFLLGMISFAAWNLWENWQFRHLSPDEMVTRLFGQLVPAGERLEVQTLPGFTPYEFAAAFSARIEELSASGRWFALSPGESRFIIREIRLLADYFVRAAYAPEPLSESEQKEALKLWRDLRERLRWARLRGRVQGFISKRKT